MRATSAKDIFLDAIELPPDRQEEFVRRSCGHDSALLARVEGLIRTHQSRPGVLDGPAFARDGGNGASHRRVEQAGDVIDRYRLIRLIGEGGFGSVFLAQQTEPLVREVALKVVRRGMDTDQIMARFAVERQALAMMDHPGIARVIDAGATASGRPYFVMEYVDGVPITQYCNQQDLDLTARLELMEQACLAVQHAHQKGIIHRDLKPGNILVTNLDGRPIPKVIDFGVAKAVDVGLSSSSGSFGAPLTLEAQIVGTPQYMSPEQATASAASIDTRTDVYSLGAILYELITGAPTFDPEILRREGIIELGRILRDQMPLKPSRRIAELRQSEVATPSSITQSRRQLADEIDWIVMKALEKEPERRYQSPADLAADIRRHLSHQAVLAGPPSRLYVLRKFARRHRASLAAAVVVLVTLLAMTITSAILASRARRAEANALLQAQRAKEELARANAIVSFTGDLLSGIGPSVARGRDTALLSEILDSSIKTAGTKLRGQPTVELAVRNLIANALYDLGDAAGALSQLRGLYDATASTELRDHPERLRAAVLMADMLVERNELVEAGKLINDAMDGYRRRGEDETDAAYRAKLAQAALDMFSGRGELAEKRFAAILEHYRGIGQGESTTAIHAWNNLALTISGQDRWAEACELWQQLNAVDRRLYGEDHPYTLETSLDIATSLTHLQRLDEAEVALRETLSTARRIFPPGHPTILIIMNNLGGLLLQMNKLEEADTVLTEALETGRQKKLGALDQPMDTIVLQLGQLRAKQKRFDEAVKYAQELHTAVAARFGERDVKTLSALVLVYDNLLAADRAAEGVAIVEKIGELPPQVPPDLRQRLLTCAGRLYLAAGNESAARRCATLARAAVQQRVTSSLRLLESQLHIVPATQPDASGSQ